MKRVLALLAALLLTGNVAAAEENKLTLLLTNQLGREIRVTAFGDTAETLWQWSPTPENGFDHPESFTYPSDARLRLLDGSEVLLTCASYGLCAMIKYPSGEKLWSTELTVADNPHAVELLPDGSIAVAASTGNFVRLYAPGAQEYAQYMLPGAHGLWWDPDRALLWAIGTTYLTAYTLAEENGAPALAEQADRRALLPIANGHDIWPVYGDGSRLWVVCTGVFQYDMDTCKWCADYAGRALLTGSGVKSAACDPAGDFAFRTLPNGVFQSWDTDCVDVLPRGADALVTYHLEGCAVYRVRAASPEYR